MITVLLVEDEKAVANVVSRILELEGLDVISANSAKEAFKLIETVSRVDVAIVDRVLPGKVQGEELAAALRKRCQNIGIIQMSGYPQEAKHMVVGASSDKNLCKPVSRQDLIDSVFYAYQARSVRLAKNQQAA